MRLVFLFDGFLWISYVTTMALREIIKIPDAKLRELSKPVGQITPELLSLLDDMAETMYAAPGIGLAAIQIAEPVRALVVDCTERAKKEDDGGEIERDEAPEEADRNPIYMINPEIVTFADEPSTYEEGCLSIPDQYADDERPAEVEVAWQDVDGNSQSERFDGLWATCVQHEIDHLNGKLFIDYLKPLKRQMITRKMQKLKREQARA